MQAVAHTAVAVLVKGTIDPVQAPKVVYREKRYTSTHS